MIAEPVTLPVELPELTVGEQAAELLRRAAYRIGQPGAWCQHYAVVLADGRKRYVYSPSMHGVDPVSTCAYGAMQVEWHLSFAGGNVRAYEMMDESFRAICPENSDWNDAYGRTQAEVVDALVRASEIAGGVAMLNDITNLYDRGNPIRGACWAIVFEGLGIFAIGWIVTIIVGVL